MAKKETTNHAAPVLPMLKTVEQMSKVSGIGENKLRELMDNGELEYVQNGNRHVPFGSRFARQLMHSPPWLRHTISHENTPPEFYLRL